MPIPVVVPKASISMEEGVIVKWLLSEGDAVTKETVLFELETDKALVEVPAPADGVLLKIITPQGTVAVETIVGWVGALGETVDQPATVPPIEARQRTAAPSTPAARRRAAELGIDIAGVTGSGPNGRITQEDVEQAAATKIPIQPANDRGRGELARGLSHAWQTVPHIHISRRMDAGALSAAGRNAGVSITDLLLFALSRLLPSFPELTCTWRDEKLEPASGLHIAFAVDTGGSVAAPVIRDIAALSLDQISAKRRELTEAARQKRLKLADLQDGVFTLTNLGMSGADFFAPIVAWPQTAILAVGRITQEPVVSEGSITIGWRMWANIALDHRAADGALGARFLAKLQDNFSQPPKDS